MGEDAASSVSVLIRNRWPSRVTAYSDLGRSGNSAAGVPDSTCPLGFSVIGAAIKRLSNPRKKISFPSPRHCGNVPPLVDIGADLPPGPGNAWT